MKPLHSQRIKQDQRILLISEKQKEGAWEGWCRVCVCVWRDERGVPLVRFVLLWPPGKGRGGEKQGDVREREREGEM